MFKKVLAGLASIALALGMVALTAGPASAHTPTSSSTCTTVTVNLTNYNNADGKLNYVTVTLDGVNSVTLASFGKTYSGSWNYSTSSATHTWRVVIDAWDGTGPGTQYDSDTGVQTVTDCTDDVSKKITLCHKAGSSGNYTVNEDSVNAIINHSGHGAHSGDIIPAFTYTLHGVLGSYPGQNLDPLNLYLLAHNCQLTSVTATAPTFANAVCTEPQTVGLGSLTIPTKAGVTYQYRIAPSATWITIGAGTIPLAVGAHVYVKAIAELGYTLSGTSAWDQTITSPLAEKCVVPAAPTFNPQTCTGPGTKSQASYVIPSSTGIQYQRWTGSSWVNISAGTVNVNSFSTTIKIQAIKTGSFIIVPGSVTVWEFTFNSAGNCLVVATPAAPSYTDGACLYVGQTSQGSYTIPTTLGVKYQFKTTIGGAWVDVVAGTYSLPIGSTVYIQALPTAGYSLTGTLSWTHLIGGPAYGSYCVAPAAPTVTDSVCNGPGTHSDGTLTIPASTKFAYQIWDGANWVTITQGTHNYSSLPTSFQLRAVVIAPNVIVPGATTSWNLTLVSPGDCLARAVPAVAFVDSECITQAPGTWTDSTYTVTTTTGVAKYEYSTNGGGTWTDVPANDVPQTVPQGTALIVHAVAATGYTLSQDTFTHTFAVTGDCTKVIEVAGDPTFTNSYCQRDGNVPVGNSWDLIFVDHVHYTWSLNGAAEVPLSAGPYTANPGDHVEVWAHPDFGYVLDEEAPSYWEHTFPEVAATCPAVTPFVTCDLDEDGNITLPNLAHVKWIVDGAPAADGPILVHLSIADTQISAVIGDAGYVFDGDIITSWVLGLSLEGECLDFPTLADWPTNLETTDPTCTEGVATAASVTVGFVEGVSFFDEVDYYLDGSPTPVTAATFAVTPGTHTVTASPKDPDDGLDGEASWEFTVAPASTDCGDLTTLALTGVGLNPIGWAGAGYFLLVSGLALIAVRTVRRRSDVK